MPNEEHDKNNKVEDVQLVHRYVHLNMHGQREEVTIWLLTEEGLRQSFCPSKAEKKNV